MTISKRQLAEENKLAYDTGKSLGQYQGKEEAKKEMLLLRQSGIVEISNAVAQLAMANAKLTYAMSRITDKLL